jgi:chromosome partitioning protein
MRILTCLNEKGGVGKTTFAQTIATGLAIKGYSVLLADGDPQGTLSESFGDEKSPGFYDLIMREKRYQDVIYVVDPSRYAPKGVTPEGSLRMLPGNEETRSIGDNQRDTYRVLRRLAPVHELIDVVVFDTSPQASRTNTMILTGSDDVVIPTQLELWSLTGVIESISAIAQANQDRKADGLPDIRVLGYVPTMTQLGTSEHAKNHDDLLKQYPGQVWRPIPRRIVWGEATS